MRFGRKEGQKYLRDHIVGDASSIVFDQDPNVTSLLYDGYRYRALGIIQCFDRVDQQIEEGLTHQNRIAGSHRFAAAREPHLIRAGTQVSNIGNGICQQIGQIDIMHRCIHRMREVQEVCHHARKSL